MIPFMYNDINQFENHRKANARVDDNNVTTDTPAFFKYTFGISKAWVAFFGEVVLLLVMNYMLPDEKNSTFWSLAIITVIVSFILIFIVIDTLKEAFVKKN